MINIDDLIKKAFVALKDEHTVENKFRLDTLKMVKSKFLEFKTSKEGVKKLIVLPGELHPPKGGCFLIQ